ncbi:MAG TPA: outer membrane beta-barrel protein [Acidiferrobacteraceae bacterium]|nr:outer membrane beta-barrel protein [Acidiferrobacteraceae bacterium]
MNTQRMMMAFAALISSTMAAHAATYEYRPAPNPIYGGAGLSSNSVSGWGSSTGFQIFGGYNFGTITTGPNPIGIAAEAGYMNTGTFQKTIYVPYPVIVNNRYQGPWATGVVTIPLASNVSVLGRAGLDLGDDSGLMAGIGAAFQINPQLQARVEYVSRSHVDSLQLNVVFYPGA